MNANGDEPDFFGPLEQSRAVRGWAVVAVAVVIGALILPSATRAPLSAAALASAARNNTTSTTTAPPATSTSTTTTTAPVAPSAVKVLVANGTNTNGAAATVTSFLSGKGFGTLTAIDALTTVSKSQIYIVAGTAAEAQAVATALSLPSSAIEPQSMPAPVSSTGGADIVVIVGPDLTSR